MSVSPWFDYNVYMANKVTQLKTTDPAGNWTMDKVAQAFADLGYVGTEGAERHFVDFGQTEDVAPNAFFNPTEYYRAKAAHAYGKDYKAVTDADAALVKAAIKGLGMNAWSHYDTFGSSEKVNPSNQFDTAKYMEAKRAALNSIDGGKQYTLDEVYAAFKAAGINALEHFMTFGGNKQPGEVAQKYEGTIPAEFAVPEDKKVNAGGSSEGETYALTRSAATGAFDNITGTTGDDTFIAGPGAAETGDVLNGGTGTDTLKIQQAGGSAVTIAPTMKGIEKIYLNEAASGNTGTNTTLSLANATGVTEVWADRVTDSDGSANDGIAFTGVSKAVKLGILSGDTSAAASNRANVTFVLNDVTGTDDAASLVLDSASVNNVTIADVETLNILGQNGSSRIDGTLLAAAATKLVFTGDKDIRIDAIDVNAANGYTVDAAAFAGNLNITLEDQAAGKMTVSGGSGNDKIYLATGLDARDFVDGGAGTNTIGITTAADLTTATGANLKNFQIFDAGGATAGNYDMDFITGGGTSSTIKDVTVSAPVTGSVVIDNLVDTGAVTINISTGGTLQVNQKGAASAGSNDDTLTFNIGTDASANVTVAGLTAANIETVTLHSVAVAGKTTGHVLTDGTFANATKLVITGDEQLTINGLTSGTGITSIDGSAMEDRLIFGAAADMTMTGVVLVKGGSANDVLFLEENVQAAGSVVQGNGGADDITINDAGSTDKRMTVKYVAQSDSTGLVYDNITGFVTGADTVADADRIDLAFLGFNGGLASVFSADAKVTVVNASDTFSITSANAAGFFKDSGTHRGVAWASDGTDSVIFIDANKDGDWSAADDMAIYLSGTNCDSTAPVNTNFVFV